MLVVSASQKVIDVVRLLLEQGDEDIRFYDEQQKKEQQLKGTFILDLFAAGFPADDQIKSLVDYNQNDLLFYPSIRRLISIFDSLHDGVVIADKESVLRYINKSFERISGASFAEMVGQYLLDVRPGARLGGVIRSGKPMLGVRRKFNNVEYITDMHPMIVNGEVKGGVTIARDITEIQQLQTKLRNYHVRFTNLMRQIKKDNSAVFRFADIIGNSTAILSAKLLAEKLATSNLTVMLRGESGTGKELFAHAIHLASSRRNNPFIAVNCAAIPSALLESELFGYGEGAFTGAKHGGKPGLITSADGGTLFLDEIGDVDIDLQAKLLRVLQTGEVQPLGDVARIKVDVRIIAATNKNLEQMISVGKFRDDLYYRLNVSQINVPALRERAEDIVPLANHFLERCFNSLGKLELNSEIKKIMVEYSWPGNVRELENTVNFIANITDQRLITPQYLPQVFFQQKTARPDTVDAGAQGGIETTTLKESRYGGERSAIVAALNKYGWNVPGKNNAAKSLEISLTTLYSRIRYYDINFKDRQI